MWNDIAKSYRGQTSRLAVQLMVCLLFVLVFFLASGERPGSTVLSAGIAPLATPPAARNIPSNAAATRTPTLRTPNGLSPTRATPTQTLRSPLAPSSQRAPRAPVLDTNTVALYHFDNPGGSVAIDATGNYTGTLIGTAAITNTPLFGAGALYTNGRDGPGPGYVQSGNLGDLPAGTLEAYIDFSAACVAISDSFSIISLGNGYGNTQALSLYVPASGQGQNWLDFGLRDAQGHWRWVTSGINPCKYLAFADGLPWPYEVWRWHHVAGTWGPRGMEIWVDGVLHGVGDGYYGFGSTDYCNPQEQSGGWGFPPNPNYPNCPAPVFSQTPVPYAYTGGLAASAYTSLLVGCDGEVLYNGLASCFKGRIDDVRISSVQRIFDTSVDPPSTPTPTQTPIVSTSPYLVDSLTTSLLHLDSAYQYGTALFVPDEVDTTSFNGRLFGNAAIVPGGRFTNGMCVDGAGSFVRVLSPGAIQRGTVEAWFMLNSVMGSFGIVSGDLPYGTSVDNFFLGTDYAQGNTLRFGLRDANGLWHWAVSGVDPSVLTALWHHIAGTWGERGLEIWIDGVLRGTNSYNQPRPYIADSSLDPFLIGCDAWRGCLRGMIDEVRFSSVQRTFAPSVLGAIPLRRSFAPVAPGSGAQSPFQVFLPSVLVNPPPAPVYCP